MELLISVSATTGMPYVPKSKAEFMALPKVKAFVAKLKAGKAIPQDHVDAACGGFYKQLDRYTDKLFKKQEAEFAKNPELKTQLLAASRKLRKLENQIANLEDSGKAVPAKLNADCQAAYKELDAINKQSPTTKELEKVDKLRTRYSRMLRPIELLNEKAKKANKVSPTRKRPVMVRVKRH